MSERVLQGLQKVIGRLRERRLAVSFAAVTEHDPKDVTLPPFSIGRNYRSARAEIDLGFHTGRTFHATERKWRRCAQLAHKPLHAVVAAGEAALGNQVLPDSLG